MLDRRDFDEWWDREERRTRGHDIGADYRHWAEAGFMAAARLMAQALRTQKMVERQRQPSISGYIRTLPADHPARLPGDQLAALLVKRADDK